MITAKCPTAEPMQRHRPRTVLIFLTGFYRTLWESVTRWPSIDTTNKAYLKQLTVLAVQARSPNILPQPFPNSLLFSLLFNFAKFSLSILDFVFMSERQFKKIDIRNKCSKMCVCRIIVKNIYVNMQRIE